ncbi:MAG: hypothetical protein NT094_05300 [Candidatus Staskawiczbacteria bacterium]|nr:hypothetical protein [Candidatus Staskawiczbacteria bacterium]
MRGKRNVKELVEMLRRAPMMEASSKPIVRKDDSHCSASGGLDTFSPNERLREVFPEGSGFGEMFRQREVREEA